MQILGLLPGLVEPRPVSLSESSIPLPIKAIHRQSCQLCACSSPGNA